MCETNCQLRFDVRLQAVGAKQKESWPRQPCEKNGLWAGIALFYFLKKENGRNVSECWIWSFFFCRNSVVPSENMKAVPRHTGTRVALQPSLGTALSCCWQDRAWTSL